MSAPSPKKLFGWLCAYVNCRSSDSEAHFSPGEAESKTKQPEKKTKNVHSSNFIVVIVSACVLPKLKKRKISSHSRKINA